MTSARSQRICVSPPAGVGALGEPRAPAASSRAPGDLLARIVFQDIPRPGCASFGSTGGTEGGWLHPASLPSPPDRAPQTLALAHRRLDRDPAFRRPLARSTSKPVTETIEEHPRGGAVLRRWMEASMQQLSHFRGEPEPVDRVV